MVAALQKGIEIGKAEQKAIDIDLLPQIIEHWWMIDSDKPTWEEYSTKALKED